MTGDRVEAAAKAIRRTTLGEQYPRLATTVRWEDYTVDAEAALAAADECDRVAGVVRVDTNDEALMASVAAWITDMYVEDAEMRHNVSLVFHAVAALAADGAQPPPEGEQR